MNSLELKILYIFDITAEIAKKVEFTKGINIITSSQIDGNKRGKSAIMKSIYYTLGADTYFDGNWNSDSKVYILKFNVKDISYYIYRYCKLFKIFDGELKQLIFKTTNRTELSEFLSKIFDFKVMLPNKEENIFELTPPAFSYILNYVDQDRMSCSKFDSFKALQQYKMDKLSILYNHFGIFNEDYFDVIKKDEELSQSIKNLSEEETIITNMIGRIAVYIDGKDIPQNIETLKIELDKYSSDYSELIDKMKKVKDSLIELKNNKIHLDRSINELKEVQKKEKVVVKKISTDSCPTCSQGINKLKLKIEKFNSIEDIYLIKGELELLLSDINQKIKLKEDEYKAFSTKIEQYKNIVDSGVSNISSTIKHLGYINTRDSLLKDRYDIEQKIEKDNKSKKELQKEIREFKKLKKLADSSYEEKMLESKQFFFLEEIEPEQLTSINKNFEASGSNNPISTIIWYINLLKVKYELNPETIKFPIVLDSPNNSELEEEKKLKLFEYIFKNNLKDTQLIVSTLGFDKNNYSDIKIGNVITLSNEKYKLLNNVEYKENKNILQTMMEL